jgi:anti-repressor protein
MEFVVSKEKIFTNVEFGNLTVMRDLNNDCWFLANELSDKLGYSGTNRLSKMLDEDERINRRSLNKTGTYVPQVLINESGLYHAVFKSNKPEAKKFRKWVTSEVMPSIRKLGMYATDDVLEKMLNDQEWGIQLLKRVSQGYDKKKQDFLDEQKSKKFMKQVLPGIF